MLRVSTDCATSVQQVAAPGLGIWTKCNSKIWGVIREDDHRCSRSIYTERPRKVILYDRYGLFYEMAGSLRHSKSRGFGGGGSSSHQLLRFGIPQELYSDQSRNFESRPLQEVLHHPPCTRSRTACWSATSNDRGCRIPPEDERLPVFCPSLQVIYSRHYWLDTN
jgi:hypothetical protein